jgi:drug/metabolite transporter (DMT)-like permease
MSPLWTSVFSLWVNKERVLPIEYLSMIICLGGVATIASQKENSSLENNQGNLTYGVFVSLMCSLSIAASNVAQRKCREVYFAVTMFYHFSLGIVFTLIYIVIVLNYANGISIVPHSHEMYFKLLICIFADFVGIVSMTIAYSLDNAGFVSIIGYVAIIYGFLVDEFIF